MAFQMDKFGGFYNLVKTVQSSEDPEMRSIAENFILEERLTADREDSYEKDVASPEEIGDWMASHENYVANKIYPYREMPETFTDRNHINLLPEIDKDQFLVRLENVTSLIEIARYENNVALLMGSFEKFLDNNSESIDIIEDFLAKCNVNRDSRPIFVGFWGEVKDILSETGDQWANRLRDRFGLGHLDPMGGEPIPVLLLRYRVEDVITHQPDEPNFAAVPTVLDSKWSPFFCPVPEGWTEGQTLDLTSGTENDYAFNCEILHRFIEYKASYVYRVGWITESPGKTSEEARQIHFKYLRDDFKYFDWL